MRLTPVILMAAFMQVSAATLAQKVSLSKANTPLKTVLKELRSQSGYNFVYTDELLQLSKPVDIKMSQADFEEVLEAIFSEQPLAYTIEHKTVVIKEKKKTVTDTAGNFFPGEEEKVQQATVSGTVTDTLGAPLPGVSVRVKDLPIGVSTDLDGHYKIENIPQNAVLTFSFLGYETQEVAWSGQEVLDIIMRQTLTGLDEVVVVGYGSLRKEKVTSSIVSINEESFNKGNINNPEQLLTGRVAGLTVSKLGGSPTGGRTIRLRGITSFGANVQPLIVIDGVVGGNLDNLDPNDIKSIDVLKDASAGAIYGTRGSSGVIIVTTKSGSFVGEPTLNINTYTVLETISDYRETASTEEFLANNGTDFGYRTDWLNEITRTSNTNVVNADYSNNTGSTSYRASVNYRDVEGVITQEDLKILNSRLNIVQKLFDDRLKLTGIVSHSRTRVNGVFGAALRQASYWNPTAPVYVDNDPALGFFETQEQAIYNPVAMNVENTQHRETKNTLLNFKADLEITKGLTLSANYSYQNANDLNGFFSSANSLVGGGYGLGVGQTNNGRAERNTSDGEDELYEFTVSYDNVFKDLEYSLLAGHSSQEITDENFYATNTDFITGVVLYNNLGLGQGLYTDGGAIAAMGSFKSESLLVSYFGRANLTFREDYNLALSYRREASSRFGSNNRWGDFWAVSTSANLSNILKIDFFDYLKLRGGYGLTGNMPNERYAYLEILDANPNNLGYVNGQYVPAVEPVSNPNPDLKWEEKGELNLGIDFAFSDGRFHGSFDYYNRQTSNLLNTIDVPSPPNLYPSSLVNLGELDTKGFEAQLNYKILDKKELTWSAGLVFDMNETKLVRFNNLENSEFLAENLGTPGLNNLLATQVKENEVIGNIMAPRFSRFNEENRALVFDSEGNEILASEASSDDFIIAGNGLPDFNLNLSSAIQYKNFDLSFLWRGVFGHSIANLAAAKLGHPVRAGMYRYVQEGFFNPEGTDDSAWHSEYIEDGSFVRLDNISIGYTLNVDASPVFKSIRFYAVGNNVVTITNYSGPDPEPRYQGNSGILAPGYDRLNNYLPTRSISLGINVNF